MESKTLIVVVILGIILLGAFAFTEIRSNSVDENNSTVVAENLEIPWGIEFLPDGDMLVTERPGTLLRIQRENNVTSRFTVEDVIHRGEGGLQGVEADPNFSENNWLYVYMTTQDGGMLENSVVRYTIEEDQLSNQTEVISGLPGAPYHDGGRIEFGPDNKLYISAGDATNEEWAQQKNVLAGKILRINKDGSIPDDNPFNNSVYSFGHRNPQGLTWLDDQLWATEHGRSGVRSGMDELNMIVRGQNYGWPVIEGNETREGMVKPVINSGPDVTWAPAGAASINNTIYFAGLRGNGLYRAVVDDGEVISFSKHLTNYGRLRAVEKDSDNNLYISTSNTDGRGVPAGNDDRIIVFDPGKSWR